MAKSVTTLSNSGMIKEEGAHGCFWASGNQEPRAARHAARRLPLHSVQLSGPQSVGLALGALDCFVELQTLNLAQDAANSFGPHKDLKRLSFVARQFLFLQLCEAGELIALETSNARDL